MKNKRRHFIFFSSLIVIIIAVLFSASRVSALDSDKAWNEYGNITSQELKKLGDSYVHKEEADSALMCYSLVMNRYRDDMPQSEKRVCADAANIPDMYICI